jgi:hypothetical protein
LILVDQRPEEPVVEEGGEVAQGEGGGEAAAAATETKTDEESKK